MERRTSHSRVATVGSGICLSDILQNTLVDDVRIQFLLKSNKTKVVGTVSNAALKVDQNVGTLNG